MAKGLLLCAFLCLGSFFCSSVSAGPGADIRVKYSYHFKECRGYCEGEMTVENRQVVFKKSSRFTERFYPVLRQKRQLTREEYATLKNILEAMEFADVQERYGCPDCYGQGSQRLEIVSPEASVDVDMEYNSSPQPLENLISFLRCLWMTFESGAEEVRS